LAKADADGSVCSGGSLVMLVDISHTQITALLLFGLAGLLFWAGSRQENFSGDKYQAWGAAIVIIACVVMII